MTTAALIKLGIVAAVVVGMSVLSDPRAGAIVGFMLAEAFFVFPKYKALQSSGLARTRNRSQGGNLPARIKARDTLQRYMLTQVAALGIVAFIISGMLPDVAALAIACPLLAGLGWVQLRIFR